MTERQRRFAVEYMIDANTVQAAIRAGYSVNYANARAYQLLDNVGVRAYIDEKTKELEDAKIAKADEVMKYLTAVMRGEKDEEVVLTIGTGEGCSSVATARKEVGAKERIAAAELIGKRYGIWTDKLAITDPPVIVNDISEVNKK